MATEASEAAQSESLAKPTEDSKPIVKVSGESLHGIFGEAAPTVTFADEASKSDEKPKDKPGEKSEEKSKTSNNESEDADAKSNAKKPNTSIELTEEIEKKVEAMLSESRKWPDIVDDVGMNHKDIKKLVDYFKSKGVTKKESDDSKGQDKEQNSKTENADKSTEDKKSDNASGKKDSKKDNDGGKGGNSGKKGKKATFNDSSDSDSPFVRRRRSRAQRDFDNVREVNEVFRNCDCLVS